MKRSYCLDKYHPHSSILCELIVAFNLLVKLLLGELRVSFRVCFVVCFGFVLRFVLGLGPGFWGRVYIVTGYSTLQTARLSRNIII